jgi:hypothetical protein
MGLDNLNLQPLLDLIGKAGEETSEYKKARAAGRVALVLFALGVLTLLASSATSMFGANSKVGILAGAVASIAGVLSQAIVSLGYSAARADVKQAAATVATAALASDPPTVATTPPKAG